MTQPSFATHEVFNQSPPFEDVDLFALDRPLVEAVAANGGAAAEKELSEFGRHWGSAAMAAAGPHRQREHPKTADLRFPRQPARRGRVSSGLSRADGAQRPCRRAQFDLGRAGPAGRRRIGSGARREILHGGAGRDRASLPDHHDPRLGGGAGGAAGSAGENHAGDRHPRLRSGLCAVADKTRHDARHGHDGKTGRHRRALQHDARGARRRCLSHHRPQMVHVGADVRRLPGAGAGRRGTELLLHAALYARRLGQCDPVPAAEGQARQPLQCVLRGRIRRRLCACGSATRARASAPSSRWCS